MNFSQLKQEVKNYTEKVVKEIVPDYIQIGNEINSGFLFPKGNLTSAPTQFETLLNTAATAIRTNSETTQIIIQYAGTSGSEWFFEQISSVDYDIIGLSYYPLWHGKDLNNLKTKMNNLSANFKKKILIAETAYPFTLDWNDWTNNIVGLEEQLILPEYPASTNGQSKFIHQIKTISTGFENGIGFCYWGAELIAWKGTQSKEGSSWENQALFDFNNKALPALKEFKID